MLRKIVAHGGSLRRTAESAKGPVCELVGFGLPENDRTGMFQHSGVFVSGVIRSSSFHPSESCVAFARTISRSPVNWKKTSIINELI
ncbi:hypothetical protein [Paracoccus sp. TOH]|uniref:hypothetical protein n=1 Tax=Paracoccus sp. TOH TaxID=1263728 RepID=UPI0025B14540|nr:hypothetical protein [Paracoccus sp. TOH]WJS83931.1 hypothetical protein NBE95_09180 [Paracoccus sp. TOH]